MNVKHPQWWNIWSPTALSFEKGVLEVSHVKRPGYFLTHLSTFPIFPTLETASVATCWNLVPYFDLVGIQDCYSLWYTVPSGNLTQLLKIVDFDRYLCYKWPFSLAMLVTGRSSILHLWWFGSAIHKGTPVIQVMDEHWNILKAMVTWGAPWLNDLGKLLRCDFSIVFSILWD